MKRFLQTLLLAATLVGGAWALYYRDQIHSVQDALQLARQQLFASTWVDQASGPNSILAGYQTAGPDAEGRIPLLTPSTEWRRGMGQIRIATFCLTTDSNPIDRRRIDRLAEIIQRFDVVSIQDENRSGVVQQVVAELNRRGGHFRFVERRDSDRSLAIVFDEATIHLDQSHWYSVNDPDRVLSCEPLVAWFRARHAPPHQAFTFTIVNLQLDPARPDQELPFIGELFRSVRNDGRGEDDVILTGDFRCGDRGLSMIRSATGLEWVVSNQATNTRNDQQQANLVFNPDATGEFTGSGGVFDLMQRLNLTLADAMSLSEQMPVWGEFSIYEGQTVGRVTSGNRP